MLQNLKSKLTNIGFVRNSYKVLFLKGEKFFARRDLYKVKSKEGKINNSNKEFNESGDSVREVEAYVDPKLNCVLGWVPYLKDKTSVLIYHFFSTNYSLRKQLLVRLSIVNGKKVISQKLFWFPAFCVYEFELKKYFGSAEGSSIIIELFHPSIRKNHGTHDGSLRAWGKYYSSDGDFISTVHTQHLDMVNIFSNRYQQSRNYFPKKYNGQGFHYSRSYAEEAKNKNFEIHPGYSVFKDDSDSPRSVCHHGIVSEVNKPIDTNSIKITQGFWCPPSKKIDPRIAIDDVETGIKGENPVEVFIVKDSKIFKKKRFTAEGFFQSNISNLFDEFITGPYYVFVTFYINNHWAYLHVNYDTTDNCGDNVHCHENLLTFENDKIKLLEAKSRGRARKFMHFSNINKQNDCYLVIHINKIEKVKDPKLKIRIFTDKKKEYLTSVDLNYEEPIKVFEIKKLFNDLVMDINKCGVVQIESTDDNFNGSFLNFNPTTEAIAVDHLTGG